MPQFYHEHYYLWGYAAFSSVAFVIACVGAASLLCRRRSFATFILTTGSLGVIGSRCLADVGWLVLSGGLGNIDYLVNPERQAPWDVLGKVTDIMHFYGVTALAVSIPMLARYLGPCRPES